MNEEIMIIFLGLCLMGIGASLCALVYIFLDLRHFPKITSPTQKEPPYQYYDPATSDAGDVPTPSSTPAQDDISEHIVLRPTAEELSHMNEPQAIKDEKDAIAETLASVAPPEV